MVRSILGVVFAYLLGILARAILVWWTKGRKTVTIQRWEDIKALVVLLALLFTAGAYLLDDPGGLLAAIDDLRRDVGVLVFDDKCAEEFGKLRGVLKRLRVSANPVDLMIGRLRRLVPEAQDALLDVTPLSQVRVASTFSS